MALIKDNKYWKIVNINVNRQAKEAKVTLQAFISEAQANVTPYLPIMPRFERKIVKLSGDNYPFTDAATPNQTAQAYINVKKVSEYFKDAIDV